MPHSANYSYRVGLELISAQGNDLIDFSLPTATPVPTETPRDTISIATPYSTTKDPQGRKLSLLETWKPNSPDARLLNAVSSASDGCYWMDDLGIFAERSSLRFYKQTRKQYRHCGPAPLIPIGNRIQCYVNWMSMKFDNIAEIAFAITPANNRLTAKSTTRFKLHLEDPGDGKVIHFMMADAGENDGAKLGYQHYEYGRTYNIRLELSANQMAVFINGYRINEALSYRLVQRHLYWL